MLIEPGFFTNGAVHTALVVGAGAALVSGVVGVFTVIRGQSFAGHALSDVSSAGGSLAFLLRLNPFLGFLGMAALASGSMELIGVRHVRGRDLATGVVLGAGLGLSALFLYLDSTFTTTTGAAITVMFGSMFTIPASTAILASLAGFVALVTVAVLYQPLLLTSVHGDLAAVRGVRVGLIALLYMLVLSLAVSLSAITVGAILSTALLIGPAGTAVGVARRPGAAFVLSCGIALGATWLGILLAYDSGAWTPQHPWPVSFFVVALLLLSYLAVGRSTRRVPRSAKEGF